MTGLILALGVAVAQFWPHWSSILIVLGIFCRRPVCRRQYPVAQAGRRARGPASGVGDLRAARLRLSVRLCRACWWRCRSPPPSACSCASRCNATARVRSIPARHRTRRHDRVRCPASASARARSCGKLCARGFPLRSRQRRGARADRALAGLAGPRDGADRAGRLRQEPSRLDLGGGGGRPLDRRALALASRSAGGLCHRRAGGRRPRSRGGSTSARCSTCSISPARRALPC